jgi:peptide/nickel transport system permease protein
MIALYIIGVACLIAIFAYPLSPDNSPNAARGIVELVAKPPGFSRRFLHLPLKSAVKQKPFLARLFTGTPSTYRPLPVNSYYFTRDSIIVAHYISKGRQETLAFPLGAIAPSRLRLPADQQTYIAATSIQRHTFLLGTDRYGRDILSRLLTGARVSIAVGIIAVLMSLSIGILLGAIAGYFRGWVDNVVMYLINVLSAIPNLLLVFAITLTMGKGFWQIFIAIGLVMWVSAARLIRGQVLVLREKEYIQAARTLGLSHMRIILRHILPNMAGPLMAIAASSFAAAILIEAGLSFLGIGVQPPMHSWGLMIREQYDFLPTKRAALALIPGIALMILAFAFNILGNALRDVRDERDT